MVYPGVPPQLALSLGNRRTFAPLSAERLDTLARALDIELTRVMDWVRDAVAAILQSWPTVQAQFALQERERIERHLALFRDP